VEHLIKVAALFRAGQFYAHHAHNNVKGILFHSDHEFFGELYPTYEAAYDGCVERYIGTCGKPVDSLRLAGDSLDLLTDLPIECGENNHAFYQGILHVERAICTYIESCGKAAGMTEGTRQMLGNLADESEVRQYKIKQRLKG